ncbi:5-oxoprolinase subunit PxpB [Kangiella marina]|uniref:5-oxoprolinase subunit PxpB n=1 Tax=Kangiella marina TaxID=1079178 RepID=A0ABP8IMC3_9GAMM
MPQYTVTINSDSSLIIEFDGEINLELTRYILGAKQHIEKAKLAGFIEAVPAYNSLLIIFSPLFFEPKQRVGEVSELLKAVKPLASSASKTHRIPVCYHASVAPDLEHVASHCQLTTDEVVTLHTANEYPVYMLGFLPGFLYLGNLNSKLHCPRREDPRPNIKAGSVAIGGDQTGVYPINSPGGWHIIGQTPIALLNTDAKVPAIAQPLDTIVFEAISLEEFQNYEH